VTGAECDGICDIAIAGGGLMGAALALLLAQSLPGRRIQLLEQKPLANAGDPALAQPHIDARSTALAPTSVRLLERLGIWSALARHATAIERVQVSDRGHIGWVRLTSASNRGDPLGYVVENRALSRVLVDALMATPSLMVRAPVNVQCLNPGAGGMTLVTDAGTVQAQLVVVADGADSPLRQRLGIGESRKDYQQSALIANVQHQLPHQGVAFERFTEQGSLAMLPLGGATGTMSALVWTWPKARIKEAMAMSDAEFLTHLQQVFGYRLGRLCQVGVRQSYALQLRLAREQVRSGLVLMGNAAHFLHPVAGQGYNLALRDGLHLAEVLRGAGDTNLGDLALLQKYAHQQAADQRATVLLSDSFNELFRSHGRSALLLRTLGMLGVETSGSLRDLFIRQLSGRASRRADPWSRLRFGDSQHGAC
jgi:2-polyprenyl-6-methoxyphenol 4-hydroxylase